MMTRQEHRLFFVSIPHCLSRYRGTREDHLFALSGRNLGNLLFTDALWRQLRFEQASYGYSFDPMAVSASFTAIVIPAANWLSATDDWGELAALLEKTTLPVYLIGIGAQAPINAGYPKLKAGTERLLRIVSERSTTIGARGDYSADVLVANGIKNVRVIGCPSLYWHCRPGVDLLPNKGRVEIKESGLEVAYSSTSFGTPGRLARTDSSSDIHKHIVELAYRGNNYFIVQSELPELSFALAKDPPGGLGTLTNDLMAKYGTDDEEGMLRYMRSRLLAFLDVGEWVGAMRRFDLVVGTRLHATIAALLGGVGARLVAHDSRTQEVAALAKIPVVTPQELRSRSLEEIYLETDLAPFAGRQLELYANYLDFLRENKLQHRMAPPHTEGH